MPTCNLTSGLWPLSADTANQPVCSILITMFPSMKQSPFFNHQVYLFLPIKNSLKNSYHTPKNDKGGVTFLKAARGMILMASFSPFQDLKQNSKGGKVDFWSCPSLSGLPSCVLSHHVLCHLRNR